MATMSDDIWAFYMLSELTDPHESHVQNLWFAIQKAEPKDSIKNLSIRELLKNCANRKWLAMKSKEESLHEAISISSHAFELLRTSDPHKHCIFKPLRDAKNKYLHNQIKTFESVPGREVSLEVRLEEIKNFGCSLPLDTDRLKIKFRSIANEMAKAGNNSLSREIDLLVAGIPSDFCP